MTERNYSQKSIYRFIIGLKYQSWISLDMLDVQNSFSWFQRVIDLHFDEHFQSRLSQ